VLIAASQASRPVGAKGKNRAMIEDHDQYEAALERLLGHLDRPLPGSPGDEEFTKLLEQIEAYNPPSADLSDDDRYHGLKERAEELAARAEAFVRRHDAEEQADRLMSFPEDGQGIGPTTGV
jgi:hypothetical protein